MAVAQHPNHSQIKELPIAAKTVCLQQSEATHHQAKNG
jgi:hypothetical protein